VGEAITFGWRERFDVLAAVQYLKARMPGQPVAVVAVSLGGAATLLATPPLEVQAAVLEAVYPSIDRAIVNRLRIRIGPFAPALAPLLLVQLRPRLGVAAVDLRPVEHIARLGCPVLVVGGTPTSLPVCADTSVSLTAVTPRVNVGERPQFAVAVSNATSRAVRILDVRSGRRSDLQHTYFELFVAKGQALIEVPMVISDPGPLSAGDFFDLEPGTKISLQRLSYTRELERLEPGDYQAFILFWRNPMEPHTTRCRSTKARFSVQK
jgi:hypothetical protein